MATDQEWEGTVRAMHAAVLIAIADRDMVQAQVAELLPWATYGCKVALRNRPGSPVPADLLARIEAGDEFLIPEDYYADPEEAQS